MSVETFHVDPEHGRDEWLALRRHDVTASVAGALLGIHPFTSRYRLWMEKAGRLAEAEEETAAMLRGRVLEAPALELLKLERPRWKITRPDVYLRDPSARMGATPDAYAVDPKRKGFGVVQVKSVEKSVFRRKWLDEAGEVEPPLWIAVQAIQEAHLAGASWACVIAFVVGFGLDLHVIDVPMHGGIVRRLREQTEAFWRSIEAGEAPDPDYGRDGALLAGIYADDNGREIDLSRDNRMPELLREREELMARIASDKARLSEIEAEVVDKLGDHERAFLPGWTLTRKLTRRKGFYVDPVAYRRLSIRRLSEDV